MRSQLAAPVTVFQQQFDSVSQLAAPVTVFQQLAAPVTVFQQLLERVVQQQGRGAQIEGFSSEGVVGDTAVRSCHSEAVHRRVGIGAISHVDQFVPQRSH